MDVVASRRYPEVAYRSVGSGCRSRSIVDQPSVRATTVNVVGFHAVLVQRASASRSPQIRLPWRRGLTSDVRGFFLSAPSIMRCSGFPSRGRRVFLLAGCLRWLSGHGGLVQGWFLRRCDDHGGLWGEPVLKFPPNCFGNIERSGEFGSLQQYFQLLPVDVADRLSDAR